MLVDATHKEETRIAIVDNGRLADFDYESSIRQQLKGSIFLAKVTRVEPSLQAAFVNFGGNRHGFLPFNEIHPDYFRIPISDREAIIAEQKEYMDAIAAEEEAADLELEAEILGNDDDAVAPEAAQLVVEGANIGAPEKLIEAEEEEAKESEEKSKPKSKAKKSKKKDEGTEDAVEENQEEAAESEEDKDSKEEAEEASDDNADGEDGDEKSSDKKQGKGRRRNNYRGKGRGRAAMDSRKVEVVGGDIAEGEHTKRPTLRKNYKIQEVLKRGQIMLVQAQKEERGNKGAAVSSYISLPGRYCVLMPNSPRGGGVSRKIANYKERKRMREILKELNVPEGMSVILRTAGTSRTKVEIKRDLDYLMRLWDDIRALTLESIAPACVYEEGNLIKRGIRDIYARSVEEVVIAGEKAFKEGKKFMKMLIPSHAKKVTEYKDDKIPLFHKYKVESQIVEMGTPEAGLKSGGSIVINPTEALVAIDVNSGRATKERHIEETALRTNLEAAEEVARQLKLRDLGGLIVIDFIDMENYKNNAKVERKLKECLSSDRARIQIGRISSFGLLEMSRQRLNPSMTEAQFKLCESCKGLGHTRTMDSTAVIALRTVEEHAINGNNKKDEVITLTVNNKVALYILNNKRNLLSRIEERHGYKVSLQVDDSLPPASFLINGNPPVAPKADDKFKKPNKNNRNKNKNKNQNQNPNQKQQGNNNNKKPEADKSKEGKDETVKDDSVENATDAPKEDKKSKPNKSKKSAPKKEAEDKGEKADDDNKKKKPSKAKVAKSDKVEKADKADDKGEKSEAKPKKTPKKKAEKKEESKETAAPKEAKESNVKVVTAAANTDEVAEENQNKDYEKVNEAPKKKKRGWWSK